MKILKRLLFIPIIVLCIGFSVFGLLSTTILFIPFWVLTGKNLYDLLDKFVSKYIVCFLEKYYPISFFKK